MGLILLEALLALCIFILIVWWTMFSGRNKGELPQAIPAPEQDPATIHKAAEAVSSAAANTSTADHKTV